MTPPPPRPVFATDSPRRWRRSRLAFWCMVALLVGTLAVFCVSAFVTSEPDLPRRQARALFFRRLTDPKNALTVSTNRNAEFHRDKNRLEALARARRRAHPATTRPEGPIRAGFYVNWDLQSYYSLRDHVRQMNLVLPEWLFFPETGDSVRADIDPKAAALLAEARVPVLPMVSNYLGDRWRGDLVNALIASPTRRRAFIGSLLAAAERYHLAGVNIDFESLDARSDDDLATFMAELHAAFHPRGLLVTQDVAVFNTDYDLRRLSPCNDLIFLMAYDQHDTGSGPGPISDVKWVEAAIADAQRHVPDDKLVLCIAGYGYDWPRGGAGTDITYHEALSIAQESEGKVVFDAETYNLSFDYFDDQDRPHRVVFTDAVTNFNLIRTAEDFGLRGVALWRLGSEDPRLWEFYRSDLRREALAKRPPDLHKLGLVPPSSLIDYLGEGEVLDVVSGPNRGRIRLEYNAPDALLSEERYDELPTTFVVRKQGKLGKQVILTFDDGPDERYTPRILDILKKERVPAAFFVVGSAAEQNIPLLKRIYAEGHEIGNHTFFHPNLSEVSPERVHLELNTTRRLIESVTGHSTILFRPPYNADAEPQTAAEMIPILQSRRERYLMVGESVDPLDWQHGVTPDLILDRVKAQESLGGIVLFHDAGGNRQATVEALPRVIDFYRRQGYRFTTVAALLGKTRDQVMPPVHDSFFADLNWFTLSGWFVAGRLLHGLFFAAIFLSIGRILFVVLAAGRKRRLAARGAAGGGFSEENLPGVSVIVPAFNEEVNAVRTVRSLLAQRYPELEVVFVDDGSRDRTYDTVAREFAGDPRVRVLTKPNGGKASALNRGIAEARHELLVCVDGDTQLPSDAVRELVQPFAAARVGAVAGQVKVGNRVNWLTRWQHIEYTTSQNLDREAFSLFNAVTVVPGAIGAFRREAVRQAGGFTTDTLAEDCDLTLRVIRAGYRVETAPHALAFTEAPETLRMFLRQRFRWSFGILQSFYKHRDALFSRKTPGLGWLGLPNLLVFQLILPLFSPLADLMLVASLLSGQVGKVAGFYALYLGIDLLCAALAFRWEGESGRGLWRVVPQRVVYRPLMYVVLLKAYVKALKGELMGWGLLNRTGRNRADETVAVG